MPAAISESSMFEAWELTEPRFMANLETYQLNFSMDSDEICSASSEFP
jgi:hypothetical protein